MTSTIATSQYGQPAIPCGLECSIASYATTRISFTEVNALRKQSDNLPGALGNSILRHSDEQTLAALAAVRDAIKEFDSAPTSFEDWGVVCSSRYLGRTAFAKDLAKFAVEGPWNVSVQVVPNRSLHSPASMVSLALGCHGPCVGVGGGLDGETDAWMTAATLLDQHSLPGIWMVFSGWEPDEHIDMMGNPLSECRCTALAIALQPGSEASNKPQLRIKRDVRTPAAVEVPAKTTAIQYFESFLSMRDAEGSLTAFLGGGLVAEMDWKPSAHSTIRMPSTDATPIRKAA